MNAHAWRIVKSKYAANAFTGYGAKIAGGRWNNPGLPLIYTAATPSLAILEILVHLQSQELLNRYVLFKLTFPTSLITTLDLATLPKSWSKFPAPAATKSLGDHWFTSARSAILRVPSVIVPTEHNYLLNPTHPDFPKIRISPKQPLKLDPRLTKN